MKLSFEMKRFGEQKLELIYHGSYQNVQVGNGQEKASNPVSA